MTGDEKLRLLVVDDQAVVRLGFTALLDSQDDMSVVGTAGDGQQAVRLSGQFKPDVVLMDIRMPVLGGIEATRLLARAEFPPKVLVLTTFDLDDYVYEALLAPAVTRRLIAEFAARSRPVPPPELGRLTPRENEVLLLMAGGLTNAEIAGRLCLAEQTVKSHVSSVLFKLELRDRVQAVILAYESGLVVPGAAGGEDPMARKGESGRT